MKSNRPIFLALFFILAIGLVSAGSVEDLDVKYKDKPCIICGDNTRTTQVDDNNVFIDADLLNGEDLTSYVHAQESSWAVDKVGGSGMSQRDLWDYLAGSRELFSQFNSFVDYLMGIFTTKTELENVQERIDRIEATIMVMHPTQTLDEQQMIDLMAALKKAKRTGETQIVGSYRCISDMNACIMLE